MLKFYRDSDLDILIIIDVKYFDNLLVLDNILDFKIYT